MGTNTLGTANNYSQATTYFTPPFAHLNLRFNPFGEIDPEDRARAAVIDYQLWVTKFLEHRNFVLQFSGDCGRGKSTHLHALKMHLQAHFPDASYSYFAENEVVRSLPKQTSLVLLDETQRIPKGLRQRLWKRDCAYIIATHEDHSREFIKHGRDFEHVALVGLTEEKLRQVLESRLELARRTQDPIPYFTDDTLKQLIEDFGDDIRAIEHHLYHIFQNLKEVTDVTL